MEKIKRSRFRIYFGKQLMGLADELDVGGEVMMRIKFRPLSFDLRNRAHDGMTHCHKEAEKLYGVSWGLAVEIKNSVCL